MARTLIFCFDGTANDPEQANDRNDSITNVLKLHLMLKGDLRQEVTVNASQMSFYFPGVGTYGGFFKKLKNKALAPEEEDVGHIIKAASVQLTTHFQHGDKLVVLGYSRGAAIARRFCALLPTIFEAVSDRESPSIAFLGVFDTVAAMNKPNLLQEDIRPASDVVFENRTISEKIQTAVHLVSSDDKRIAFYPTLMNRDACIREVWFPGAHSDVGGGNQAHGLSDISLEFMCERMKQAVEGLEILSPTQIQLEASSIVVHQHRVFQRWLLVYLREAKADGQNWPLMFSHLFQ